MHTQKFIFKFYNKNAIPDLSVRFRNWNWFSNISCTYRVHTTEDISRAYMGRVDKIGRLADHTPIYTSPPLLQNKKQT